MIRGRTEIPKENKSYHSSWCKEWNEKKSSLKGFKLKQNLHHYGHPKNLRISPSCPSFCLKAIGQSEEECLIILNRFKFGSEEKVEVTDDRCRQEVYL